MEFSNVVHLTSQKCLLCLGFKKEGGEKLYVLLECSKETWQFQKINTDNHDEAKTETKTLDRGGN